MIYDLNLKFLFYDGGLGGDALARAITCRLPLSNNYDTSYCDKSLNKHSCNDVFSGLLQKKLISKEEMKKAAPKKKAALKKKAAPKKKAAVKKTTVKKKAVKEIG